MKRSVRRWVLIGIVGAAVLATGAFFGLKVYDYPIVAGELPSAMERAKAAGVPLISSDLDPGTPGQSEVNTVGLFGMFDVNGSLIGLSNLYGSLLADRITVPEARLQLAVHKKILDELCRVASLPSSWARPDWDLGPRLRMDIYQQARGAVRVLCARALINAEQGDLSAVLRDLDAARALSTQTERGGLIGLSTRLSLDSTVLRGIEACLARFSKNPQAIDRLRKVYLDKDPVYDLRGAIRGEGFFLVTAARNWGAFQGGSNYNTPLDTTHLKRTGIPSGAVEQAQMARALDYSARCLQVYDQNPASPIAVCQQIDEVTKVEGDEQRGWSRKFIKALTPVYSETGKGIVAAIAESRCMRGLALAMAEKARTAQWPTKLPSSLTDPFDSRPIRMTVQPDRVRVWSVGRDGQENGGLTLREVVRPTQDRTVVQFDIVASYPPIRPIRRPAGAASVN